MPDRITNQQEYLVSRVDATDKTTRLQGIEGTLSVNRLQYNVCRLYFMKWLFSLTRKLIRGLS